MENILKVLEEADTQLSEISTKISAIETQGVAFDLKCAIDRVLEKQKSAQHLIWRKKTDILKIIISVGCQLNTEDKFFYSNYPPQLTVYFSRNAGKIRLDVDSPNDPRSGDCPAEKFVDKYPLIYYKTCRSAIKFIGDEVARMSDSSETDHTALAKLQHELAEAAKKWV